ncbi:MAG TPA: serine/threonine-protein kinase [Terriglobales bacterium]|nr:serine/threonine-protein kinase [Terriglobales bacterium]
MGDEQQPTQARKIGRYEIVAELGRGAMGVVYRATDPNIGRTVALKTMRIDAEGIDSQELLKRFRQEARAAGVLNHPNVVTIYDAGEHEGLFYMAMEYIEGRTLQTLLAGGRRLAAEQVVDVARQVCAGLDYAHARGIVHRDIKPANIMITAEGVVKIMDFGIAKTGSGMTSAGQVLGTPSYMSPEQVRGQALDGRSDLFSLGVVLYESVTGKKPFVGESITAIIYKIVAEDPVPPAEYDPELHPGLAAIVIKALAKTKEKRYQRGADLVHDLENYKRIDWAADATLAYSTPPTSALRKEMDALAGITSTGMRALGPDLPTGPPEKAWQSSMAIEPSSGVAQAAPAKAATGKAPAAPAPAKPQGTLGPPRREPVKIGVKPIAPPPKETVAPRPMSHPPLSKPSRTGPIAIGAVALVLLLGAGWLIKQRRDAQRAAEAPPAPAAAPESSSAARAQPAPAPRAPKPAAGTATAPPATDASTTAAATPSATPAATTGELRVVSTPVGASIELDGQTDPRWKTPYLFPKVDPGTHRVALTLAGYARQTHALDISAGKRAQLAAVLQVSTGIITVASTPPGASVMLDGEDTGKVAPAELTVEQGAHTVTVHKEGFAPLDSSFDVKPGQNYTFNAALRPQEAGKQGGGGFGRGFRRIFGGGDPGDRSEIDIRTKPPGAEVTIDGLVRPKRTPGRFPVEPGTHKVTLRIEGRQPVTREITVKRGEPAVLDEALK